MLASAIKVFETTRQPFLVLDARFHVMSANRAFWALFPFEPEETLGRSLFATGHGAWDSAPLHHLLEHVLPAQHVVEDFEWTGEFGAGGRRVLLVDVRELAGDHDEAGRLILLGLHDVTGSPVDALVTRTRRDLERSNRDLQEFASVASHDLQEPLRKILAFGERLQSRSGASLDAVATDCLARMLDASRRMRRLIDDALECARLSAGTTRIETVALHEAVTAALANLPVPAGGTVEVSSLPTIEADAGQMRQLFQNLLSNACKFRRDDFALVVTVDAERVDADTWAITVADNGMGFDQQHADRVFGVFERLHGRQFDGSGIGLAVCRRIVERHHGSIEARGAAGAGASFVVRLPTHQHEDVA